MQHGTTYGPVSRVWKHFLYANACNAAGTCNVQIRETAEHIFLVNTFPLPWCFIAIKQTTGEKYYFESQYKEVSSKLTGETSRRGRGKGKKRKEGRERGKRGKEKKKGKLYSHSPVKITDEECAPR